MIWRLSPAYALRASGRSAADRGIRSLADFDITRWMGRQSSGRQERPVLCAHPLGATRMGRPGVAVHLRHRRHRQRTGAGPSGCQRQRGDRRRRQRDPAVPGHRAGGRAAAARGTGAAPRPQGAVRHSSATRSSSWSASASSGRLMPPTCSSLSAADRFQPRAPRPERAPNVTLNTTSVAGRTADRRGCLFNAERDAIQVCDCRARLHSGVQDAMRSRALALLEASGWCSSVQGAADTRTAQVRSLR